MHPRQLSCVDYTDSVCYILLSRIYDIEIHRKALADPSMVNKPSNNIICAIKSKELARDALATSIPQTPAEAAVASSFVSG